MANLVVHNEEEVEESWATDSSSDEELAPYTMMHVVQFCRKNWTEWVKQTHTELMHYQRALTPYSSRVMANNVLDIDNFYQQMVKVSLSFLYLNCIKLIQVELSFKNGEITSFSTLSDVLERYKVIDAV